MPEEFDLSKLSLMIFPTRFPREDYYQEYQKAYECWKNIWGQALKDEMNVQEHLYSDNFSRHTHILVVFYNKEVASLMTLNYMDMNDPVALNDSYFKVWPELTMQRFCREFQNIIVTGSFTINTGFRKTLYGICWKRLTCAFLVRHLKSSSFECAVATPRLERKVEKICYDTGAITLHSNLPYVIEGQRIDLVCWHRDLNEKNIDPHIWSLVNTVWKKNTIIIETSAYHSQGEKHAA